MQEVFPSNLVIIARLGETEIRVLFSWLQLITLSPFSAFEPVGSQKQEEVRDGGRGKEEGFYFPARWPLTPLRVRLLSLPRLRRPHCYGPEYTPEVTQAPGRQGNHQGEHQGGTHRRTPLRRLDRQEPWNISFPYFTYVAWLWNRNDKEKLGVYSLKGKRAWHWYMTRDAFCHLRPKDVPGRFPVWLVNCSSRDHLICSILSAKMNPSLSGKGVGKVT